MNVASLHAIVTHRRDTSIEAMRSNRHKPVFLSDQHVADLRTAPFLGERHLFPQEMLDRIQKEREEYAEKHKNSDALSKLASTVDKVIQNVRPQQQASKRKQAPTATQSVPPDRQAKKQKLKLSKSSTPVAQSPASGAQKQMQSPSGQASQSQPNR